MPSATVLTLLGGKLSRAAIDELMFDSAAAAMSTAFA